MVKIDVKGIGEFSLLGDGGDLQMFGSQLLNRLQMSHEWATRGKPSSATVMSFTMKNTTLIYDEDFKGDIGEGLGLPAHGM